MTLGTARAWKSLPHFPEPAAPVSDKQLLYHVADRQFSYIRLWPGLVNLLGVVA